MKGKPIWIELPISIWGNRSCAIKVIDIYVHVWYTIGLKKAGMEGNWALSEFCLDRLAGKNVRQILLSKGSSWIKDKISTYLFRLGEKDK
jgi:hypothetical protein